MSRFSIGNLRVYNFKSIESLELDCSRVNLFIGEPNTGKSNILEALGLLSHVHYSRAGIRDFIRLESMVDIFHHGDLSRPIQVCFDSSMLEVKFRGGVFRGVYSGEESKEAVVFEYSYDGSGSRSPVGELSKFKLYRFRQVSCFPSEEARFLLPPDGANLLTILRTNRELRHVAKELLSKFRLKMVLKPHSKVIEVQTELEDIVVSLPYSTLSETLQRLIFHLAAMYSNRESIILFEEPEAHSFPYYIKYLAERIALDESNQYFISTHNPYLLSSILEKAPSEEVATFITYYEEGKTRVRKLTKREVEEVLSADVDIFFNIERFLERA